MKTNNIDIKSPYFKVIVDYFETSNHSTKSEIREIYEIESNRETPNVRLLYPGASLNLEKTELTITKIETNNEYPLNNLTILTKEFPIHFSFVGATEKGATYSQVIIFINHTHKNFLELYKLYNKIWSLDRDKEPSFNGDKQFFMDLTLQLEIPKTLIINSSNQLIEQEYYTRRNTFLIPLIMLLKNNNSTEFQSDIYKKIKNIKKTISREKNLLLKKEAAIASIIPMIPDEIKLLYEIED